MNLSQRAIANLIANHFVSHYSMQSVQRGSFVWRSPDQLDFMVVRLAATIRSADHLASPMPRSIPLVIKTLPKTRKIDG